MNLYKNSTLMYKKSSKLNYFSSHVLRSVYLIKVSSIHHTTEKKIFARGSRIPRAYINHEIVIHRGNKFTIRYVNPWLVGFKFGEFTWNRKIALYKAKAKKKKKK
jgi:ribosomal protein S19